MFEKMVMTNVASFFARSVKNGDVGIEIECERHPSFGHWPEDITGWQAKPEGSLQEGMEYVSKPTMQDKVYERVQALSTAFTQHGVNLKPSYRCSTHIHVNFLKDTMLDVLGMMVVWAMFEPVLLAMCGSERDGNLFCLSNYDTGDLVASFDHFCKTLRDHHSHGWGYERGKYCALNTGRLPDLGTVEIRCFPMSTSAPQIETWVSWLMNMKAMAKAEQDKTYRTLWKSVRGNKLTKAVEIFGPSVWSLPELNPLMDMGTEIAYEMTRTLRKYFSEKPKEQPEKKARRTRSLSEDAYPGLDEVAFADIAPIAEENW